MAYRKDDTRRSDNDHHDADATERSDPDGASEQFAVLEVTHTDFDRVTEFTSAGNKHNGTKQDCCTGQEAKQDCCTGQEAKQDCCAKQQSDDSLHQPDGKQDCCTKQDAKQDCCTKQQSDDSRHQPDGKQDCCTKQDAKQQSDDNPACGKVHNKSGDDSACIDKHAVDDNRCKKTEDVGDHDLKHHKDDSRSAHPVECHTACQTDCPAPCNSEVGNLADRLKKADLSESDDDCTCCQTDV